MADPVFGAVYKLAAVKRDGVAVPKIKISETVQLCAMVPEMGI